jgi:hypothetical protein
MKAIIDLTTDTIVSWGILYNNDPNAVEIPDDYSPERYTYTPITPGVFNPNGFSLITTITQIDANRRQNNLNQMNSYMSSFIGNGLTQANFDLFLSDTAALQQQYLGGGGRLITWVETVNRNGYNATTVGFKTRTGYRGPSSNGVEGVNGNYIRANTILNFLNDL